MEVARHLLEQRVVVFSASSLQQRNEVQPIFDRRALLAQFLPDVPSVRRASLSQLAQNIAGSLGKKRQQTGVGQSAKKRADVRVGKAWNQLFELAEREGRKRGGVRSEAVCDGLLLFGRRVEKTANDLTDNGSEEIRLC